MHCPTENIGSFKVKSFKINGRIILRRPNMITYMCSSFYTTVITLSTIIFFITDPSEWNSIHMKSWLTWCTRKFSLKPAPDPAKFPASGSDLCDLTRSEIEKRTGNARSAAILAKHLACLRQSVTGRATSPLNVGCDVFRDEEEQG